MISTRSSTGRRWGEESLAVCVRLGSARRACLGGRCCACVGFSPRSTSSRVAGSCRSTAETGGWLPSQPRADNGTSRGVVSNRAAGLEQRRKRHSEGQRICSQKHKKSCSRFLATVLMELTRPCDESPARKPLMMEAYEADPTDPKVQEPLLLLLLEILESNSRFEKEHVLMTLLIAKHGNIPEQLLPTLSQG